MYTHFLVLCWILSFPVLSKHCFRAFTYTLKISVRIKKFVLLKCFSLTEIALARFCSSDLWDLDNEMAAWLHPSYIQYTLPVYSILQIFNYILCHVYMDRKENVALLPKIMLKKKFDRNLPTDTKLYKTAKMNWLVGHLLSSAARLKLKILTLFNATTFK